MNPLEVLNSIKSDSLSRLIIDSDLLNNELDYSPFSSYNEYLDTLFYHMRFCKNLKTLKIDTFKPYTIRMNNNSLSHDIKNEVSYSYLN